MSLTFYPRRDLGRRARTTLVPDTNLPEDQEDAVEGGQEPVLPQQAAGLGQALEIPDHGDTFRAVLQVRPERRSHSRAFW
jgi:hypothetical protein